MSIYANIFSDNEGAPTDFGDALGVHFYQGTDPIDTENKVMRVVTVPSGEPLPSVTNISDEGYSGEVSWCEMGMRYCFEPMPRISSPHCFAIQLRDSDGGCVFSLHFDAIEYSRGEGSSKIALKYADGTIVEGAILNAGRWYTLRAELFCAVAGGESRLKLTIWDGGEMISSTDTAVEIAGGEIRRAAILHYSEGIEGVSYFDDVYFALGDKKYSYFTHQNSTDLAEKIYSFDEGIPSTKEFNIEMLLQSGEERMLLDPATWTSVLQSEHFKHSRNLYEILLVLSGSGHYFSGDVTLPFSVGSIFVSAPGVSREIVSHDGYKILSVSGIFDKLSRVGDVWALADNVYGEGRKLAELILYNRFGKEAYVESLCNAYVEYLLLSYKQPTKNTTAGIYKIIDKINKHFGQMDLSIGDLLDESGYTRDYIRAEFVSVTGMTPKKYLNNIRMKNAKNMIEMHGEHMSFSEIAVACGIIDQSIFSRIFKQHFGISPTEYRDSLKK